MLRSGPHCDVDGSLSVRCAIHIYRVPFVTSIPKPCAESNSKDVIKSVKWLGKTGMSTA